MNIKVPQVRKSPFEPQVVKKRQNDISDTDQKIMSIYAKGMTNRQVLVKYWIYLIFDEREVEDNVSIIQGHSNLLPIKFARLCM